MKEALAFAVILYLASSAYSKCLTCAKGPSCTPVSTSCTGQGYCIMAWGTENGVMTYMRGCAGYDQCKKNNCTDLINAPDCNFTCCSGTDDCNSAPFPTVQPVPTTVATTNATSTGMNQTTPAVTTKPVVIVATTDSPAGIASVSFWALASLLVGSLGLLQ